MVSAQLVQIENVGFTLTCRGPDASKEREERADSVVDRHIKWYENAFGRSRVSTHSFGRTDSSMRGG